MSDWKFKMGWEEFERECTRLIAEIDQLWNGKQTYYEMYEPERWGSLHRELMKTDKECTAREDLAGVLAGYEAMLKGLKTDDMRLGAKISKEMVKKIHVLKGKAGLDEEGYRKLLARVGGVASSLELKYWQGMVLLRRLHEACA